MPDRPNEPIIQLADSDKLFIKLRALGNSLKPYDDENYTFFEAVRELLDAALTNYGQLRLGYIESNCHLIAWACRNLLELLIFTKYVLNSKANAERFAHDRLIDGCEIIESLRDLELHCDPKADTSILDGWLASMTAQKTAEGVTAKRYLASGDLAKVVGMKEDYAAMNKVCSKLVHPTSWSVLAMNKGTNSFPQAHDILFASGVGYMSQIYLDTNAHNTNQGMKPNP
jgi:hypothetical protein